MVYHQDFSRAGPGRGKDCLGAAFQECSLGFVHMLWTEFCRIRRGEEDTEMPEAFTHTEGRPCAEAARRWSSASHGERPQNKIRSASTLKLDCQPPELREDKYLQLNYPACGILIRRSQQAETEGARLRSCGPGSECLLKCAPGTPLLGLNFRGAHISSGGRKVLDGG